MKHRRSRKRPEASAEDRPVFVRPRKQADLRRRSKSAFFDGTLTVGRADDQFEKEADATADAVVGQRSSDSDHGRVQRRKFVQRQGAEEEEPQAKIQRMEEEEAQTKLQRQAAEEEEPQAKIQRQGMEEEELQAKIQRMEEEEAQTKLQRQAAEEEEPVQTKRAPGASSLSARIEAALGKGRPLPAPIRREMEERFGADFTHVRIHTGVEATELCEHLRAEAFTRGTDIFFHRGRFNPNSQAGRHLLAHELTHVIQQNGTGDSP